MSSRRFGNGVFGLELAASGAAEGLAQSLADFLQPWLTAQVSAPETTPDLLLHLRPSSEFGEDLRQRCNQPFVLRSSSAADFNLVVRRGGTQAGKRLAWDPARRVGYCFDPALAKVDFFGDAPTAFIHLIELVRYYGLLVEQSRGTAVLHSAAVHRLGSDEVVAIVGVKGAGKTTTMLSMVAEGQHGYFSGDKVLLDVLDGQLRARGWPDYPHIGLGTLRQHQGLARSLGVTFEDVAGQPLPDQHKVLLPPSVFHRQVPKPVQGVGTLKRMILPRIHTPSPGGSMLADAHDKEAIAPKDLFEWPHEFVTATWHGLPATRLRATTQVPGALLARLRGLPWEFRYASAEPAASGQRVVTT